MKKYFLFLFILFPVSLFSQEAQYGIYCLGAGEKLDFTGGIEMENLRTEKSETWKFQNGKIIIKNCSKPLHFVKNGKWEKINLQPKATSNGKVYQNQQHQILVDDFGKVTFDLGANNEFHYLPALHNTVNLNLVEDTRFEFDGGKQIVTVHENAVKSSYFISEAPSGSNEYTNVQEQFILPEGAKIEPALGKGKMAGNLWFGTLIITGEKGESIGTIGGAICIDASKEFYLAGYEISHEKNTWKITTVIQNEWLLDEERNYPVEVDPLITGPTSIWTNGYMPSCFMPNYNVDSMLVSIPGSITVTGLLVGASYYADPFTAAWMSDGSMYFSTTCGQTEEFTVTGQNANLAGTAYLENFDMRNPLMCCYTPTCSDQSFYLRMHLGRSYVNDGCNTNYIYYDMFTLWPFTAYIEGHTVESYGSEWTVPTAVKCTNDCSVTGTIRMRYGVPPYTITHPWMQGSVVVGTAEPCDLGNTAKQISLTIPNCPEYCNTNPTLAVPPPSVVDACGNVISGLQAATLNRKPAPNVNVNPSNLVVCNNEIYAIDLTSCVGNATITWGGNGEVSSGSFTDQFYVADSIPVAVAYNAFAELDGCYSDTLSFSVQVLPTPEASFAISQNPTVVSEAVVLTDQSNGFGSSINQVDWDFGDGNQGAGFTGEHQYDSPGVYIVCESITTENNCVAEVCQELVIVPATVEPVNIMTPNGDNKNDALMFEYIEFYPENHLMVFNRWGGLIFESKGYNNTWNAEGVSDGTYFYTLKLNNEQELIESDLYIKRD